MNNRQGLTFFLLTVLFLSKSSCVPPVASGKAERWLGLHPRAECFHKERSYPQSGTYVFVGFNLLHPVEQALIDALGDKAQVIQDTDEETPKDITFISAPTNNIQARYVSTWLKENHRIDAGSKTAIVLADESLLQAVIHCLPPEVTKVNITTGYPLSQTAAASNPKAFLNQTEASPLEAEAQFRMYTILNRLQGLVDSGDLQVEPATLQHLLTQIITSTTIPFHG